MPRYRLLTVVAAAGFLLGAGAFLDSAHAGHFIYHEQTGGNEHQYSWDIQQQGKELLITSHSPEKFFATTCNDDGETLMWSYKTPEGDHITAKKEGDIIHVTGKKEDQVIDEQLKVDRYPWYQPLSFSLRPLVLDDEQQKVFVMIRPDTLESVTLKAEKKECGNIELNRETVNACAVEVKKNGLLAPFWHVTYWFRKKDGVFLQYRGVHGLPGTPETVIQLVREEK